MIRRTAASRRNRLYPSLIDYGRGRHNIAGSTEFFGAVVGKKLKVTGSGRAHYDKSLHLESIDPPNRTTLVD